MAEITARVETAMLAWHWGQIVTVERTEYVDLLLAGGRLTEVLPGGEDLEEEAGEEPAEVAEPVAAARR